MDHIILKAEGRSRPLNERAALVILDRGTGWIHFEPVRGKHSAHVVTALRRMTGLADPSNIINRCYSDGSLEIAKALGYLCIRADTAAPYRPRTNAVAERAVHTVIHGTRTILEQAQAPMELVAECGPSFHLGIQHCRT
jgi:hypothetical protein